MHQGTEEPRAAEAAENAVVPELIAVPELIVEEHEFQCGFAPRIIQYSLNSDRFFVGCKDGTVTTVRNLAGKDFSGNLAETVRSQRASGKNKQGKAHLPVRALAEWYPGWLLIGRDGGVIELLHWEGPDEESPEGGELHTIWLTGPGEAVAGDDLDSDGVTYLEWLDPERLLVSYRRSGSLVVRRAKTDTLSSVADQVRNAFRLAKDHPKKLPPGLCAAIRMRSGDWILVAENGSVWRASEDHQSIVTETTFWPKGEVPGFVTDFAYVKAPHTDQREREGFDYREEECPGGAYISTDNGVYLIYEQDAGHDPQLKVERIPLPGIGKMCIALTHFAQGPDAFLWVSDSAGDAHLFWSNDDEGEKPNWRRSGIRHDSSQVMLAFASWRTLGGGFVVGQARRNDSAVVSYYRLAPKEAPVPEPYPTHSNWERWLLRHGNLDGLKSFLTSDQEENVEGWEPEALLAELFEKLGENQTHRKVLREFLSNPTADLASCVLGADPKSWIRAVEICTQALLGTVNRLGSPDRQLGVDSESLYLGIIRWLRALAAVDAVRDKDSVQAAIERQIKFVRKWGLFGASRLKRSRFMQPIEVLSGQGKSAKDLDYFAYEALLFYDQVDLELEDDRGRALGRTAWDIQTTEVAGRLIVAVSWIRDGIEIYEVEERQKEEDGYRLVLRARLLPSRARNGRIVLKSVKPEQEISPDPGVEGFGHSRAIVLGCFPNEKGYYLLASPAQQPDSNLEPHFELWRLTLDTEHKKPIFADPPRFLRLSRKGPRPRESTQKESVYSLLEIEPGLVVAGLRGNGGTAQVALVSISESKMKCCWPDRKLTAAIPEGKSIARNRVWSLAGEPVRAKKDAPPCHKVYAGCGDGQVWLLAIPNHSAIRESFEMETTLVGKLGAPVWALACRKAVVPSGTIQRVFAGGSDGTIIAWQELPSPDSLEARDGQIPLPGFASVWASWEEGAPIARLQVLKRKGPDEGIILAVTQSGQAILFDDRASTEETGKLPKQQRLKVPGDSYARLRLRNPAFASTFLELPSRLIAGRRKGEEETRIFARLISGSNDGRIQVYTLHYPTVGDVRKEEYKSLAEGWLNIVCEPPKEKTGKDRTLGKFLDNKIRLSEAVYAASPSTPLMLVRALLEPDAEHWRLAPQRRDIDRQWLPRLMRPLFDLHKAWEAWDETEVDKYLVLALERAWRMRDHHLFSEIIQVVLNRANHLLFDSSNEPVSPKFFQTYRALIRGIERSMERWVGEPQQVEIRIRIGFAKDLTDGDTLWSLCSRWDDQEKEEQRREEDPAGALRDRIYAIRTLLMKGSPLLALECLRATNFSLLRLCRRLTEDGGRSEGWRPGDRGQEVPWQALEEHLQAVCDVASRASGFADGVRDALAHEIARALALLVCACPSASLRVANLMTDAGLISQTSSQEDKATAVLQQLRILDKIGVLFPEKSVEVFRKSISSRSDDFLALGDPDWTVAVVGQSNHDELRTVEPFLEIVRWLHDLTSKLSSDASGIDVGRAAKLCGSLPSQSKAGADRIHHSREFWRHALSELSGSVLKESVSVSRRVRPQVVLLSRDVNKWCEDMLRKLDLDLREYRIFQPQYWIYKEALEGLGRAARSFPESAAIQKNIVLGVLGHGLLESLDEHVLELEEVAQALDPLLVWDYRENRRQPAQRGEASRADHFATFLLERSREAESIPKNLRTLKGLLDANEIQTSKKASFRDDLLAYFWPDSFEIKGHSKSPSPKAGDPGWTMSAGSGDDIVLTWHELRFLQLTLIELDQNDRNYGPSFDRRGNEDWPAVLSLGPQGTPAKATATFRFRLRRDLENFKRLEELKESGIQKLIPPRKDRFTSHGMGLYLGNLAASVVGWRLGVDYVDKGAKEVVFSLVNELGIYGQR